MDIISKRLAEEKVIDDFCAKGVNRETLVTEITRVKNIVGADYFKPELVTAICGYLTYQNENKKQN